VRNLGFEDTPDYDYLRELFTQALKNTGEVEDGEYDWMKLTKDSKNWDAMKHPGYLHNPNERPGPSQVALHGNSRGGGTSTPHQHLTVARLNAAQPPPPSPIKQMGNKRSDRPSAQGASAAGGTGQMMAGGGPTNNHHQQLQQHGQRVSAGVNAALRGDMATPTGSTQAQFQNSTQNLPQRMVGGQGPQGMGGQAMNSGNANRPVENQPTGFQKFMKVLCCGT
jgi:casein kinase 1